MSEIDDTLIPANNQTSLIVMTQQEALDWKVRVGATADSLRLVLYEGYSRQAWRALGFNDWTDCVKSLAEEFELSERHIWRLHSANQVEENLLTPGSVGSIPEKQLRPLAALPPEQQRKVWQQAQDTVDGPMTAAHVQQAVEVVTGRQKPKLNRAGNEYVPQGFDACQTPAYALTPLLPYLNRLHIIWEPARGEGLLEEALWVGGLQFVVTSDLITGQNFFEYQPEFWDCIVTNPPYSLKYQWLERCYTLGKPFALLLPVETLGAKTAQVHFRNKGIEVILMDRRVNFKMPNVGFEGSAAQFPVAWFCWGLDIGRELTFAELGDVNGNGTDL